MKLSHLIPAVLVAGILCSCTPEERRAYEAIMSGFEAAEATVEASRAPVEVERYTYPDQNVERWHDTAIKAGWSEADWPILSALICRESTGDPTAINPALATGTHGLTQIHSKSWTGSLKRAGIITSKADLLNPLLNLRSALWVRDSAGWEQWNGPEPDRCVWPENVPF
jgi:hypothetical protein